ncbi:MAG TPA: hypothetical protein ENN30_01585 [Candidatus Woesearchaeota archaeon]|nr:hypothetical protein [Candidatus Woesearchaeota archaeon]
MKIKMSKLNVFQTLTAVLAVALIASIGFIATGGFTGALISRDSPENTVDFINKNLLPEGLNANVVETVKDGGVTAILLEIQGEQVEVYTAGDYLFLSGMKMSEFEMPELAGAPEVEQQAVEVAKAETPKVELFVMSHCPYGTQIEKGIIPVVELLKDKIDFEIKFCDYAMHGELELDEQMLQVCIQKEYKESYLDYLKCFLVDGKTDRCLDELKLDTAVLNTCIEELDSEFKVKELFADKSTWLSGRFPQFNVHQDLTIEYGVRGSPSLVLNEQLVNTGRSPAELLQTICMGFEKTPEECLTSLDNLSPAPGFGYEGYGDATTATCG